MKTAYVPKRISDESLRAMTCGQQETLERIAELEAALEPFAASARMMSEAERTDEDVAALVLGTDLTPSDFWTAMHVMTKSD